MRLPILCYGLFLPPLQFGDARFQFCDFLALFFQLRLRDCSFFRASFLIAFRATFFVTFFSSALSQFTRVHELLSPRLVSPRLQYCFHNFPCELAFHFPCGKELQERAHFRILPRLRFPCFGIIIHFAAFVINFFARGICGNIRRANQALSPRQRRRLPLPACGHIFFCFLPPV